MSEPEGGDRYACSQCGRIQPGADKCDKCGFDVMLDVARSGVRELLRETDERLRDRYHDRNRVIAVGGGIIVVVAMWFIPHFWEVRADMFALPFLADQIILMVVIALGFDKLLERRIPKTKFPWLEGLPPATKR